MLLVLPGAAAGERYSLQYTYTRGQLCWAQNKQCKVLAISNVVLVRRPSDDPILALAKTISRFNRHSKAPMCLSLPRTNQRQGLPTTLLDARSDEPRDGVGWKPSYHYAALMPRWRCLRKPCSERIRSIGRSSAEIIFKYTRVNAQKHVCCNRPSALCTQICKGNYSTRIAHYAQFP